MRKGLGIVVIATLMLTLTGCFKYAVKVGEGGDTSRPPVKTRWAHHLIFGLVSMESDIDVKPYCPSGNATVTIQTTFLDGLVNSCIGGWIWAPSTVEIYCDGSRAGSVELSPEETRKLVASDAFLDAVAEAAPERLEEAEVVHHMAVESLEADMQW